MIWIKRIIKTIISLGIIYIVWIILIVLTPDINDYLDRTEFNRTEWINWEETESTAMMRWNMTHDLTKNYSLVGMTLEKTKELLGTPSSEIKNETSYYLGMTGHGINSGTLRLKFKNNRVVSFKISQG